MKFKILTLAVIISVYLSSANAGLYAGASAGVLLLHDKLSLVSGSSETNNTSLNDTGYSGRLFAGYSFDFDKYYLGLEATGELNSAEVTDTVSVFNTKANVKNSYSLSILPGYHMSDNFLFYGRAGVAYGMIETSSSSASGNNHQSVDKIGGQLGVGTECTLTEHLNLRLEYVYTAYTSADEMDILGASHFNNSISTNAFNLGLNYRF